MKSACNSSDGTILYVTAQTPFGGGEVWALREMLALKAAGCQLSVVPRTAVGVLVHEQAKTLLPNTITVPLLSPGVLAALLRRCALHPRQLIEAVKWTRWKSSDIREFIKGLVVLPKTMYLADVLASRPVRHVHAHSTTTVANVAAILARFLGCPFSFTLHTSATCTPNNVGHFRALLTEAQFARVISHEVGEKLLHLVGSQYASKIRVIPLGVHCELKIRSKIRQERPFRILTPAALIPHKGHQVALTACRMLLDQGVSDFRWKFCGEGPLKSQIETAVRALGLTGNVELLGIVPNEHILEWYRSGQISAVILPSVAVVGQHEGIPHALMQAMGYGVPVVATDSGSTLELIGGGAGVLVPQGDAATLAHTVKRLMRDGDFCRSQGERGRTKIETDFSTTTTVDALLSAFLISS